MNTYLIIIQGQYYRTEAYTEKEAIENLVKAIKAKPNYEQFLTIFTPIVINFDKVIRV